MDDFDTLIQQTRALLQGEIQQRAAHCNTYQTLPIPLATELPIAVGPHAGKGIVLKSNTAVELGGAADDSCALMFITSNTTLVNDGCVALYGPDIFELKQSSAAKNAQAIPFAQIIFVAGKDLTTHDVGDIFECQYVKDYIDGYLIRNSTGQLRSRVSYQLADAGFSFSMLASALSQMIKQACPAVTAVEVAFITEASESVRCLAPVRNRWTQTSHDLRKAQWSSKGFDIDCPSGGHCGSCADKATCDRVRAIARMRKEGASYA